MTETRRAASAESRGPRGPIRRWTRARPADVIDPFLYVVVLNLAIEYTPSVISESFTLSLLTAALLKIALELVILLKTQVITRLRAADTRRAKLAAAGSLWVVAAGSKLVVLELVDLVFGDAVSLGGFISVMLLVVALLASRAAVRQLLYNAATAALTQRDRDVKRSIANARLRVQIEIMGGSRKPRPEERVRCGGSCASVACRSRA